MMELCDVHTILRLPTGIFYSQGIKTNVVFLTRGNTDIANTKSLWVYDMRTNMNAFGKTRLLTVDDFRQFEKVYGNDPQGKSKRKDEGETGRFRRFTRDQIKTRNDSLDISWLRDDNGTEEDTLTEPDDISAAIVGHLKAALAEIEAVTNMLQNDLQNIPRGTV
jgi:type I restriction enzyme M protein